MIGNRRDNRDPQEVYNSLKRVQSLHENMSLSQAQDYARKHGIAIGVDVSTLDYNGNGNGNGVVN